MVNALAIKMERLKSPTAVKLSAIFWKNRFVVTDCEFKKP